ncbi:MAG: hypothetical protein DRJ41_00975 [Thermoprotei archaeon]|nr:MAG: hypothetical protein DRJ41_00975 [Thermoprotei archaeon]
MASNLLTRENEVFKAIRELLRNKLEFVVVGGYAVSGLARHRFSVDLDIVVEGKDLHLFEEVLSRLGFVKEIEKTGFDRVYSGRFVSYVKRVDNLPVTVDLLVDSLTCRSTRASWSYEYIRKNSVMAEVVGVESSVRCRVVKRELLIALKIHSGRKVDLRDIVFLAPGSKVKEVVKHSLRGDLKTLLTQVEEMLETLKKNTFIDSLKATFQVRGDTSREVNSAIRMLKAMKENLERRTKD